MRGLVLATIALLAACSAGGSGDTSGAVDSGPKGDTSTSEAGDAADETSGCLFACEVPAPTCTDDCTSLVQTIASCAGGVCKYTTASTPCPTGCDKSTGACDESGCKGVVCGEASKCGATCSDTKMCCTKSTYDRTTGPVSGTGKACCDDGDTLAGVDDKCAVGSNHGANPDGLCVDAWEGAGNGGTACGTAHCVKLVCP
jgi:hypothetical protein